MFAPRGAGWRPKQEGEGGVLVLVGGGGRGLTPAPRLLTPRGGGGSPPGGIQDSMSSEKTGKKRRVSFEVGGRGAGGDQTPHERGMAIAASAPP